MLSTGFAAIGFPYLDNSTGIGRWFPAWSQFHRSWRCQAVAAGLVSPAATERVSGPLKIICDLFAGAGAGRGGAPLPLMRNAAVTSRSLFSMLV
jgi:hypothetical protein